MEKNERLFFQLLRDFLIDYLPVRRNYSNKTVRAYRQTFILLRYFFSEKKNLSFDKICFSCFSRSNIYDFLIWMKDGRNNSLSSLNLRLSVVKSFLKYCSEEKIELMPVYLEVASIHAFKETAKTCVEYLTPTQLKLLFQMPDLSSRIGRRNRFFLIMAYETGARLQELLDLQVDSIIRSDISIRMRMAAFLEYPVASIIE
jgi:integrase/recombinase XerD